MLRALVAALALANVLFWVWSAGWLEDLGWARARERDPARLAQQVRPDAVRVLAPEAARALVSATSAASAPVAAASAPASSGTEMRSARVCLEIGPYAGAALEKAEAALAATLAEGSWARVTQEVPASYAVVLGPFDSRDALQKKREEVARTKLPFETLDLLVNGGNTQRPGLALGRYDTRAAAEAALKAFTLRGVRTARVAMLRAPGSESRLRIEGATAAQVEQLRALSAGPLPGSLASCATPAPVAPSAPTS